MELCFLFWNWIHFERDSDEYDMEMIPETKLENFDLTDFEFHSVILKRINSNIFCLHSKNKNLVEEQREDFSCTAWFVRCATRFAAVNLKNIYKELVLKVKPVRNLWLKLQLNQGKGCSYLWVIFIFAMTHNLWLTVRAESKSSQNLLVTDQNKTSF